MAAKFSVAAWKAERAENLRISAGSKRRLPMSEAEITINLLIAKARQAGVLQFMAIKGLKTADGKVIGWPAYYAILKEQNELKAAAIKNVGGTVDAADRKGSLGGSKTVTLQPKSRKK